MSRRYFPVRASYLLIVMSVAGCTTTSADYKQPQFDLPDHWPAQSATSQPTVHVGEQWWGVYGDPVLDRLEDEALAHNANIQIAAARLLELRAQLGVTEAAQSLSVGVNASANRTQSSKVNTVPIFANGRIQNSERVTLDASYEIDLWGKLKLASTAARAQMLSAESARDAVGLTLTANVAQQYFALISLDAQEILLRRVLDGRLERRNLDQKRLDAGTISGYEMHQSDADVAAAQSQLTSIAYTREKQESQLALLLGRSPREIIEGAVERGAPNLAEVTLPEGLPSDLLLRRPDLKQAEQNLVAQQAEIGVARAAFFPSISLTAYLGSQSTSLAELFSGPAGIFQFAASISQSIFNGGAAKHGLEAVEARRDQALLTYKQAVTSAFADVRDALSAQTAQHDALTSENLRRDELEQVWKLVKLRYDGGITSRLEYLDAERNYIQAELSRLDVERAQRVAVADLVKAMGGGW